MQDIVREKLAGLVGRFGLDLCNDPKRCEGLLRDVCGEHKREILALVSAARDGVASELRRSSAGAPKELILARLTKRLHDNAGLAEDLARWAVESWAIALGMARANEFRFPFKCPKCGAEGKIATKLAGQKIRCPKCNASLFIAGNGREVFLMPDTESVSQTSATTSRTSPTPPARPAPSTPPRPPVKSAPAPIPFAQPLGSTGSGVPPPPPPPDQPLPMDAPPNNPLDFLSQVSQPAPSPYPQQPSYGQSYPADGYGTYAQAGTSGGYAKPGYRDRRQAGRSYQGTALTSMIAAVVALFLLLFAFVFGVLFTVLCIGAGITSIVQATNALSGMSRSQNDEGKGLAIGGLVMGIVILVLLVLVFLLAIAAAGS